jgi:CMP-N,N'-diacetyllegionaminic acid synthase
MKIIAHIPARHGSKRVKLKNLKMINDKPLIYYSIRNLKKSKIKEFYINTDSKKIAKYAIKKKCKVFYRKKSLANDSATSDQFNYDFMKNVKSDICVMVNPVCPLITFNDINKMLNYFIKKKLDTLISAEEINMQCFYKKKPINIKLNEQLQPSQLNKQIIVCNWAITIWKTKIFINNYNKNGFAVWGKKRDFYILPKEKSLKISTISDLNLARKTI